MTGAPRQAEHQHRDAAKPTVHLDLSNVDAVIDLGPTIKRLNELGIFRKLGPIDGRRLGIAVANAYLIGVAAALLAFEAAGGEIDADTTRFEVADL